MGTKKTNKNLKISYGSTMALTLLLALSGQAQTAKPEILKTIDAGQKPSGDLKIKSSKVPTYEIHKNSKTIPLLKIGTEPTFEASVSPVPNFEPLHLKFEKINPQPQVALVNFDKKKQDVAKVGPAISLASGQTLSQIPDVKALKEVSEPELKETNPDPKDITTFKPQQYKILEGLIYLDAIKNDSMAMAQFAELLDDKEFSLEANYLYGVAASHLGLPSEFRSSLLKAAKQSKDKDLQVWATETLVQNMGLLTVADIKEIDPLVQKLELDTTKDDTYHLFRAKYYLEAGQLAQVEESLQWISEKSPHYNESLLISGLSSYRQAQLDEAIKDLSSVLKKTDKTLPMRTIAAITLARIYFQKSMYKEAYTTYLEVEKTHPLWLQAMVEQAWTQIMIQDYEGAAGNMFSLHTDFFKNAFNPESYVVRTVGYLNLCQFGDSMQALSSLGRKYAPYYTRLEKFHSTGKKSSKEYYDIVRTWLKNTDLKEVEGVPRSFIVELARHPSFVAQQKLINNYEDEITAFSDVTLKLVQREKDLLKKQTEANQELNKIRLALLEPKAPVEKLKADEALLHKKLLSYKYQYGQVNKARNTVKDVREKSYARIDKEKSIVREKAADAIKSRYSKLVVDLKQILDQNEVLQYEVYAGAGEHIRYQASGGDVPNRDTASNAPARDKDKSVKWNFKGEIWEDEIGHFRSSLKNVCAEDNQQHASNK